MTPREHVLRQRRHLWQCNDQVHEWEAEWFTESFYQESKTWYDAQASRGNINPPWSVWASLCPTPTFPSSTEELPTATSSNTMGSSDTSLSTSSTTRASPSPTAAVPSPTASSGTLRASGSAAAAATVSSPATGASTASLAEPNTYPLTSSAVTSLRPSLPPAYQTESTQWDWQAKGTVLATGLAIVIGALLWGVWATLRHKFKTVYTPRSWFLPSGSRPPPSTALATLAPFLHLPPLDAPSSVAQVMSHVGASTLAIAGLSAVVGLGTFLPLSIAGVPHLSDTAPLNWRRGKLGSVTDLSLLRLLNALDPSPDSPAAESMLVARNLPSTIAPVLTSSRPRLIAILVIMTVLWLGGTLTIVWRTYAKLTAYAKRFEEASDGQNMVFIPASKATAWQGLTETGIKRRLLVGPTDEGSVAGVFAIGRFQAITEMVREREHVLDVLETAEAKFIKSFQPEVPGAAPHPGTGDSRLSPAYKMDSGSSSRSSVSASHLAAQLADFDPPGVQGSLFLEVNQRNSVLRNNGRLNIGDKVVQDEDGTFIPALKFASDSDDAPADTRQSYMTLASDPAPSPTDEHQQFGLLSQSPQAPSVRASPQSTLSPSALADLKAIITWSRSRLRKLNGNIDEAQQKAMKELAKGEGVIGWIVVGRGVRSLPYAQDIPGLATEDVIWDNLGGEEHRSKFWAKVAAVGACLALAFLPILSLAMSSAPGFAHYIKFLAPLAQDNGVRSGVAESWVPAVAITLLLGGATVAVSTFAEQAKPVSYTEKRFLSLRAATYLLLVLGAVWVIVLGGILFATDAFTTDVQKARAVGDGIMYTTWLCLVLVINLCIVVPAIMVLQPWRLLKTLLGQRKAVTPRQRFRLNQPPNFSPDIALAPVLTAVFYISAFSGVFPILAAPAFLLAYLSLVAHAWLTSNTYCVTRGGMSDGSAALWVVRRVGWAACLQPLVFGLILLSRQEWAIGGAGVGIAVLAIAASEGLTIGLHRRETLSCFSNTPLNDELKPDSLSSEERAILHQRLGSDHSILAAVHTLLPGLGRLSADNPLPFATDAIDDMVSTERAMQATPDAAVADVFCADGGADLVVSSPTDPSRGLIYPPELLQPAPTIWLPRGEGDVAQHEAASLLVEGLSAIIDPPSVALSSRA